MRDNAVRSCRMLRFPGGSYRFRGGPGEAICRGEGVGAASWSAPGLTMPTTANPMGRDPMATGLTPPPRQPSGARGPRSYRLNASLAD